MSTKAEEFRTLAEAATQEEWFNDEGSLVCGSYPKAFKGNELSWSNASNKKLHEYREKGQEQDLAFIVWCANNRDFMNKAISFFERKDSIRAAIAQLKKSCDDPEIQHYSTACVDAALTVFDREAHV